jgi:hypothetical protein
VSPAGHSAAPNLNSTPNSFWHCLHQFKDIFRHVARGIRCCGKLLAATIRSVNFASLRPIKNVFPDATGRFNHDLTRMSDLVSRLSFDAQQFVAGRYAKEFRNYNTPIHWQQVNRRKKKAAVSSRRAKQRMDSKLKEVSCSLFGREVRVCSGSSYLTTAMCC